MLNKIDKNNLLVNDVEFLAVGSDFLFGISEIKKC